MPDPLHFTDPFRDEFTEHQPADHERLQTILHTPRADAAPRRSTRRRRRWTIGAGCVVGATFVASGTYAVTRHSTATNPTGIACHADADLNSSRLVLPATSDAVSACAEPWQNGTFSTAGAPPLVACVNTAGTTAVFPGDDTTCAQLGLATLDPTPTPEQQALIDLHITLTDTFSDTCLHQDEALAMAQGMLDESDLAGWQVQLAEDFPPGYECASATPIPDLKTVIVGGARPDS